MEQTRTRAERPGWAVVPQMCLAHAGQYTTGLVPRNLSCKMCLSDLFLSLLFSQVQSGEQVPFVSCKGSRLVLYWT